MFGLSVEHLAILTVAALFIIGPERLPGAAAWLAGALRKARGFATSARDQITAEMGPEFDELRKPLQELSALRGVDPRAAVSRFLLDDSPAAPSPVPGPVPSPASNPIPSTTTNGSSPAVDMEAT